MKLLNKLVLLVLFAVISESEVYAQDDSGSQITFITEKDIEQFEGEATKRFFSKMRDTEVHFYSQQYDSVLYSFSSARDVFVHYPMEIDDPYFHELKDKSYKLTRIFYLKLLEVVPSNVDLLADLAIIEGDLGMHESVIQRMKTAIKNAPDDPNLYYILGNTYRELGEFDEALSSYSECLSLDSSRFNALNNRAVIHLEKGKYDLSISDFKDVLELVGDSSVLKAITLNNLGEAYMQTENYEEANIYFRRSELVYPNNPFLYRNLAILNLRQNNMKKACFYIEAALEAGFTSAYGTEMESLKAKHCE